VRRRRPLVACLVAGALGSAAWPRAGRAFSEVAVGDPVPNATLPALGGGTADLLSKKAAASVFVFFRPHQERSLDALRDLVRLQRSLAGKPVRFVGVVSGDWSAEEVRQVVAEAGVDWPVLIDEGDALYGRLGVRLHPVVGICDRSFRLAAYEHFRQINFHSLVEARIGVVLGELGESDVARVLEPERATTGSVSAVARRDLNLARALWKRGNAAKALEYAERSLAVEAGAPAHALVGTIHAAAGRCGEALPHFEAALKIDPSDAVSLDGQKGCAR
jgi:tetratricopeptide (TPR) repeat protein